MHNHRKKVKHLCQTEDQVKHEMIVISFFCLRSVEKSSKRKPANLSGLNISQVKRQTVPCSVCVCVRGGGYKLTC